MYVRTFGSMRTNTLRLFCFVEKKDGEGLTVYKREVTREMGRDGSEIRMEWKTVRAERMTRNKVECSK